MLDIFFSIYFDGGGVGKNQLQVLCFMYFPLVYYFGERLGGALDSMFIFFFQKTLF